MILHPESKILQNTKSEIEHSKSEIKIALGVVADTGRAMGFVQAVANACAV